MYSPQLKTLEAYCTSSGNIAPRPSATTYTPLNLTIARDPSGIVISPFTVDPLNDPQIQMFNEIYQSGSITMSINQGIRGAIGASTRLQIGIYVITSAGVGSWLDWTSQAISSAAITAGNEIIVSYPMPILAPDTTLLMTGTIGFGMPFGSGITLSGVTANFSIKCTATNL